MSAIATQVMLESPKTARKPASLAMAEYDKAGNLKAKYIETALVAGPSRVDVMVSSLGHGETLVPRHTHLHSQFEHVTDR